MPDISMCANQFCPRKEDCYRFTATPSPHRQSYAVFKPDADGDCEHYWDNEKQQKANKL
tara:strand:- start:34167 stop:34343 length:177 start_codon:yes stop_codon:yes gene_type:complete